MEILSEQNRLFAITAILSAIAGFYTPDAIQYVWSYFELPSFAITATNDN